MLKKINTPLKNLCAAFAAVVLSVGAFGTTAYAQNNDGATMTIQDVEALSAQYRGTRAQTQRYNNRDNRVHDHDRYNDRRNNRNRNRSNDDDFLGSIVGGTLGAIIGNEIGGDEGAVLGAIIGGTAGYGGVLNDNNRRYRANDRGSWGYGNRGYGNQGYSNRGYGFNQAARCNFETAGARYDFRTGQRVSQYREVCFNSRGQKISSRLVR